MTAIQIVVADDEPEIRALVAEVLADEGYIVQLFGDGLSALAAIQRCLPRLAILDVAMPVMTGDETLRQLRAAGTCVPVIMMTAGTNPERLLGEGADRVLAKPFDLHALIGVVTQVLRQGPPLARVVGAPDGPHLL